MQVEVQPVEELAAQRIARSDFLPVAGSIMAVPYIGRRPAGSPAAGAGFCQYMLTIGVRASGKVMFQLSASAAWVRRYCSALRSAVAVLTVVVGSSGRIQRLISSR